MASTSKVLREKDKIFLIGNDAHQIIGSKLPSNKQVLQVLFFNMRKVKLNLRQSAKIIIYSRSSCVLAKNEDSNQGKTSVCRRAEIIKF